MMDEDGKSSYFKLISILLDKTIVSLASITTPKPLDDLSQF